MKRMIDVAASATALLLSAPVIGVFCLAIWLQDRRSPLYRGERVGQDGRDFRMVKLRSMVVDADRTGVDSTATGDARITPVGRMVRRYKLDEVTQFWNVLVGDMTLVGPRPNVPREVDQYTTEEMRLLDVRPGITDLASVVFSDEGEILGDRPDPDLAYNQLIRPWKSRLGLLYVDNCSFSLDLTILTITVQNFFDRPGALARTEKCVRRLGGSEELCLIVRRSGELAPHAPPGVTEMVRTRLSGAAEPT